MVVEKFGTILRDFYSGDEGRDDSFTRLSEAEKGEVYRITSISDKQEDIQRLLPLNIIPGSKIELVENPSFGALMIRIGEDEIAISRNLASGIMVKSCQKNGRQRYRNRFNDYH